MSDPNENYPLTIVHVHTSIFYFWAPKFSHLATKKNPVTECAKHFCGKESTQVVARFLGILFLEIAIFR